VRQRLVVPLLTLAVLIPLWSFPRLATQDGPSHLYNTSILLRWNEPGSIFPQVFERDLTPMPNWLGTAALMVLMRAIDPPAAEHLLVTLCVVGMAAAWWWWVRGFARPAAPLSWLGPLLAISFFLFKGFYGFCLSVPLFLCTAAFAWRCRSIPITPARAAILNALLAVTWLAHIVSFGVALIASGSFLALGPRGLSLGGRLRRALWLAPGLLLAVSALATASEPSSGRRWGFGRIAAYLVRGEWLVSREGAQMAIGAALIALLAGLAAWGFNARRHGDRTPPAEWAPVLAAAGVCVILCFTLPRTTGGGDFLTDRLAMFPVLLLAPLAGVPPSRAVRSLAGGAIVALTLAQAGLTWQQQASANRDLAEYLSLEDVIAPGSIVLPLTWQAPDADRFSPLRHAACHYALRAGAVNLADYEATTGHFQIRFRDPVERTARVPVLPPLALVERRPEALDVRPLAASVDYLITWNLRAGAPASLVAAYGEAWDVAAEKGRLIVFRARRV
jgi:hypothetical protein